MTLFKFTGNRQVQALSPIVTATTFWAICHISAPLRRRSTSSIISRSKEESPFVSIKKSLPSTENQQ